MKITKLARSQTSKDATVLSVGGFISLFFGLVFIVFVGRWLGPVGLGVISAIVSFIAIAQAVGDFGLGSSMFRFVTKFWTEGEKSRAQKITSQIFTIRLVSSLIIFLVIISLGSLFKERFLSQIEPVQLIVIGVGIFGVLMNDFLIQVFQSQKRFFASSVQTMCVNLTRVVVLFIVYFSGRLNLTYAISVYALAPFFVFLIFTPLLGYRIKISFKQEISLNEIKSFTGWMGITRVISALNGRIDTLILLSLVGANQLGIYSAARQLSFAVPIIIGSLSTVIASRFASIAGNSAKEYFKNTVLLSMILVGGLVFGAMISPFVISLFGERFSEATGVLRWLLIGFIPFVFSISVTNLIIYKHQKPKFITLITLLNLPITLVGLIILTPKIGIYSAVVVNAVGNLLQMTAGFVYVNNHKDKIFK